MSFVKEIVDLKSDINTTQRLPLLIVSAYGFNIANIENFGTQASYAMLINSMIAMVHRMFCESENEMERKLY